MSKVAVLTTFQSEMAKHFQNPAKSVWWRLRGAMTWQHSKIQYDFLSKPETSRNERNYINDSADWEEKAEAHII